MSNTPAGKTELVVTIVNETKRFTYARIGYVPGHPTNGNLIWHLNYLGLYKGEREFNGDRIYNHIGYEEYDGMVVMASSEQEAIEIVVNHIGDSHSEHNHWTVELIGQAVQNLAKPIIMVSNTGA